MNSDTRIKARGAGSPGVLKRLRKRAGKIKAVPLADMARRYAQGELTQVVQ